MVQFITGIVLLGIGIFVVLVFRDLYVLRKRKDYLKHTSFLTKPGHTYYWRNYKELKQSKLTMKEWIKDRQINNLKED